MQIRHWPSQERPREKLINQGADTLSDAELLAIFLRTGVAGKNVVDLARDLLNQFGGLRKLLEAGKHELCQHRGLGKVKYTQLQAILEISRRYLHESLSRGNIMQNPAATKRYLSAQLRHYQHEVFACLFLDSRHRVIAFEKLFHGTINSAPVHPREVIKRALAYNAAAVIFAHNHPSGIADISHSDKHITEQLKGILELLEVRVLDHLIVGDNQVTSFAEEGLL